MMVSNCSLVASPATTHIAYDDTVVAAQKNRRVLISGDHGLLRDFRHSRRIDSRPPSSPVSFPLVRWKITIRAGPRILRGLWRPGAMQTPSHTGIWGKSNVYSPPRRKWYFDRQFYSDPPPGTLSLVSYNKGGGISNSIPL